MTYMSVRVTPEFVLFKTIKIRTFVKLITDNNRLAIGLIIIIITIIGLIIIFSLQ